MRLSDAMMLGAVLKRHVSRWSHSNKSGCVLQLALAGAGLTEENGNAYWPFVWHETRCPDCGYVSTLNAVIGAHLNDLHKWNIERIADWVRAEENRLGIIGGEGEQSVREMAWEGEIRQAETGGGEGGGGGETNLSEHQGVFVRLL